MPLERGLGVLGLLRLVRGVDLRFFRKSSWLIAVLLLAATVRGIGIDWGLPETYEEATPLREAWDMWGWGAEKSVDLNPHFFNYPSLIIYLQFGVQVLLYLLLRTFGVIGGTADYQLLYLFDKTGFFIAGRLVTAVFGVLTVWFTYRLARRIGSAFFATAAALLLAVNTFHIDKSQVIEVDVPLTCFVVAAMWIFLRLADRPTLKHYMLAGLTIGLAASTKYTGAALALPFVVAHVQARRQGATWRRALAATGVAFVAFALTSPFILLDPATAWRHISAEGQHMQEGHFGEGAVASWHYYLGALGGRLLGWPLAALSLCGVAWLALYKRRRWAVIVASFFVPYVLVVSSWSMHADRYLLPALPIAIILAVAAVDELGRGDRLAAMSTGVRTTGAVVVLAGLLLPQLVLFPGHLERMRPDTRTLAKKWIEKHIAPGALIVREHYGPRLFGPVEFWEQSPEVRDIVMNGGKDVALYGVQVIPLFSVRPERSAVFYDIDLYEMADIIVTSSTVKGRYMQDTVRFRQQAAFYAAVDERFKKVAEFAPGPADRPTVTVFWNPHHQKPFAYRDSLPEPTLVDRALITDTGAEGAFYLKMGLNCEMFGFYDTAVGYYDAGLEQSRQRENVFSNLATRRGWCYMLMGDVESGVRSLQAAADAAPWPQVQQQLRKEMQRLEQRGAALRR